MDPFYDIRLLFLWENHNQTEKILRLPRDDWTTGVLFSGQEMIGFFLSSPRRPNWLRGPPSPLLPNTFWGFLRRG